MGGGMLQTIFPTSHHLRGSDCRNHALAQENPILPQNPLLLASGLIRSAFDFQQQAVAVWKLLDKYADTPMDFADACLVRMTEILPEPKVWTTDSDFLVYRRHGRTSIPLLAPWEDR